MCRVTRPVFILDESSGRISEKARLKGSGLSQIFQSTLAENFKMAAMTQLAKLFSRTRRAAKEGLHSVLTTNNKMSKRHFMEELSFEKEVVSSRTHGVLFFLNKRKVF